MEIISENGPERNDRPKKDIITGRNLYLGLILVLIGGVWLLRNFDIIDRHVFDVIFSWQALLIALGGYFMVIRKWPVGIILMVIGLVFAMEDFFRLCLPVGKVILPVILIGAGVAIALQRK